ncbi:MAG TPA: hypothetical protein VKV23_04660 [Acidimicrobiales bacterium]|jgi:hypothetical protein|nr:hypothetical protein [Acidimicrobiales bacterium]
MRELALFVVPAAVVVSIAGVAGSWRRGRPRAAATPPREPPSLVRILTSEDQLREAARHAADFERSVAEHVNERVKRYESFVGAPVVPLPPAHPRTGAGRRDQQPHSA